MLGKFFSSRFQRAEKVVLYCLCTAALVVAGFPVAAGAQQAYPDIAATSLSGPGSATPLQAISVTYTIRNLGQVDAGGFNLGFYLSSDSAITTADIPIGTVSVCGLPAGAQLTVPVTLTIPSGVPMGTYYLGMAADAEGYVAESDETNNSLAGNLIQIVYNLPDLVPTAVSTTATTVYTGENISASGTVVNYGAPIPCTLHCYTDDDTGEQVCEDRVAFKTAFVLSSDNLLTGHEFAYFYRFGSIAYRGVCGLGTGQSTAVNFDATVNPYLMPGDYNVGLIVDDLQYPMVSQTDVSNDTLVGNNGNKVTVIGPDLVMVDVSGPESARIGDTINVSTTAKTLAGGAPTSDVRFCICTNPDPACTADFLSSCIRCVNRGMSLAPLETSSTVATPMTIWPQYNTLPGIYYIKAFAEIGFMHEDSWFSNEVDRSNNCMVGNQITLTAP